MQFLRRHHLDVEIPRLGLSPGFDQPENRDIKTFFTQRKTFFANIFLTFVRLWSKKS